MCTFRNGFLEIPAQGFEIYDMIGCIFSFFFGTRYNVPVELSWVDIISIPSFEAEFLCLFVNIVFLFLTDGISPWTLIYTHFECLKNPLIVCKHFPFLGKIQDDPQLLYLFLSFEHLFEKLWQDFYIILREWTLSKSHNWLTCRNIVGRLSKWCDILSIWVQSLYIKKTTKAFLSNSGFISVWMCWVRSSWSYRTITAFIVWGSQTQNICPVTTIYMKWDFWSSVYLLISSYLRTA